MKKSTKSLLSAAAFAGLLAGGTLSLQAAPHSSGPNPNTDKDKTAASGKKATSKSKVEKHACKGMNSCKGKGGCGSTKGKNDCKGKGECRTDGKPMDKSK
ncbi:MAG: hypothetical protein PHX83_03475 [Acidobacteriia bacterium]|nr:hypothetical protein [Terriglobia bacterium]